MYVWTGLPDEIFNEKPNNAKKRPEKGRTDCLKARKKPNFICSVAIPMSQKTSIMIIKFFLKLR